MALLLKRKENTTFKDKSIDKINEHIYKSNEYQQTVFDSSLKITHDD